MNTETTIDTINTIADTISERLGPPGKAAWDILYNQAILDGNVFLVIGAISAVVYVTVGFLLTMNYLRSNNHDTKTNCLLGIILLSLFVGVPSVAFITNGYLHVTNPSYYALQEIIEIVK